MTLNEPRKPSSIVDMPIGDVDWQPARRNLVRYLPRFNDRLGLLWLMTLLGAGISSCTDTAPRGAEPVPMNRSAEPASAKRDTGIARMQEGEAFAHPGLLHTENDFERMRVKVAEGAQPWTEDWQRAERQPSCLA